MQFTIPQFIDIEDKILGPISTKQFVVILIGVVVLFTGYKLLPFAFFIFYAIFTMGFVGLFGFLKVNGQPFNLFLLNVIQTFAQPMKKIWKKDTAPEAIREEIEDSTMKPTFERKAPVAESRLSQLSLIVDTGGAYRDDDWEISESDFLKGDE